MKHKLLFFLFLSLFCNLLLGQPGTIKVAKPKPPKKSALPKDTVLVRPRHYGINIGANYTFKDNKKVGYEGGLNIYIHFIGIGLQYCIENQYYQLSAYNKDTKLADVSYSKSQNESQYIKLPIELYLPIAIGKYSDNFFAIGVSSEYLIKNKNEFVRLHTNDFNRFNVAGYVNLSFVVLKFCRIGVKYSKDIFENLKDRNIYDSNGSVIGKQKSRTNLLTFSLSYPR